MNKFNHISKFKNRNLAEFFYSFAKSSPNHEALNWEKGSLTYGQMLDYIEAFRTPLTGESNFVGILAAKSPIAYSAVQAILAEGKAYVPLNPIFPASRNRYVVQKAKIDTLIVGEECATALAEFLKEWTGPLRIITLDKPSAIRELVSLIPTGLVLVEAVLKFGMLPTPLVAPAENRSAYVLFTSGSTGVPKGVRITHDNVFSYLESVLAAYPIYPQDRVTQTFDLTFDVSVHDQFVTWASGATLVPFPDKALFAPLAYAAEKKVTVWFSVPALAAFLESARQVIPGALPQVRLSLFAGEKLTWKTCQIWKSIAPHSRLANLYGPTEATIVVIHFEIPEGFPEEHCHQGGIPIGRIFPTQRVVVLRENGTACEAGEVGGMWVSGDQVAPGYLEEPEKTAERFVEREGVIWYRTGDLVAMEPGGIIQYEGREDFQVKVMGYRIELGEIEHALMKSSGSAFAIADVAKIRNGQEEIYCVLPKMYLDQKKEIKTKLKNQLPSYMIPRHLYFTDDIPFNANGKMDRGVLKLRATAGLL